MKQLKYFDEFANDVQNSENSFSLVLFPLLLPFNDRIHRRKCAKIEAATRIRHAIRFSEISVLRKLKCAVKCVRR